MRTFLSTLLLCSIGIFTFPSCSDEPDQGLNAADVWSSEHRCKAGGKPGLPYGTCKGIVEEAQQFFQGQLAGNEREIFATELKQRLDTGLPTVIVDVRPVPDFSAAHIPTSMNLPVDALFAEDLCPNGSDRSCDVNDLNNGDGHCQPMVLPTDGTPIILVSSNGHAASLAAGVLGTMGYNVYVLRFGMIGWAKSTDVQVQQADRTQRIQGLGGPLEL